MALVKSLVQNPYRILGVSSNDSAGRIEKHIAAFAEALKTNHSLEYQTDFVNLLGHIRRSAAMLEFAKERLDSPRKRLAAAFFWFAVSKASDAAAFTYLKEGNIEKAEKAYAKKEGYAARLNSAALSFMKGDILGGIGQVARLLFDDQERNAFTRAVAPGELISRAGLAWLFIEELARDEKLADDLGLSRIDSEEKADTFLRNILAIHERLAVSVFNVGPVRSMPIMALKSAQRFLDTTAELLVPIQNELGSDAPLYLFVSSWVANEAMSMIVANVNFMQNCPPGTETLRTETAKAEVLLKRLLTLDITDKLRGEIENNLTILAGIQAGIREKHDKGRCYIATMAYGSYDAPDVQVLRRFRDRVLKKTRLGRMVVCFYYRHSPAWVALLKDKPFVNTLIRTGLGAFARFYDKLSH